MRMTAPGNSALVVSLVAVFVASAAYAIGRLHLRREMDRDREDAYRDGYDNATRRTFSLAGAGGGHSVGSDSRGRSPPQSHRSPRRRALARSYGRGRHPM